MNRRSPTEVDAPEVNRSGSEPVMVEGSIATADFVACCFVFPLFALVVVDRHACELRRVALAWALGRRSPEYCNLDVVAKACNNRSSEPVRTSIR